MPLLLSPSLKSTVLAMFVVLFRRQMQSPFTARENPEKKRKKEASNLRHTSLKDMSISQQFFVCSNNRSPLSGMQGTADIEMYSGGRDCGQEQPMAAEEMQKLHPSFPQVWPGALAIGSPFLTGCLANYLGILIRELHDLPTRQHQLTITLINFFHMFSFTFKITFSVSKY